MNNQTVYERLRTSRIIKLESLKEKFEACISGKIDEPLFFTVRISNEGERIVGVKLQAKVLLSGKLLANPYNGEVVKGERWYHGNLQILEDQKKGIIGEVRAFTLEINSRRGYTSEAEVQFRLTKPAGDSQFTQLEWL